ncbi:MAG: hypothetical protein OEZ34_04235 [Spirochaetia bacterium]|nr:hypothetical protein [Spirochaetia bacterium]
MEKSNPNLTTFVWRIAAAQAIAYFIAGIFALMVRFPLYHVFIQQEKGWYFSLHS